jgi:hypothetical protein
MTSVTRWAARLVGAGLLGATAGIHAYLWDNGYRSLISASILCLVVLATPQRFLGLASLAGAGLLAGTMIGLIIFTNFTIFNFRESTAEMLYWQSITVESIGIVILGGLAAANLSRSPGR